MIFSISGNRPTDGGYVQFYEEADSEEALIKWCRMFGFRYDNMKIVPVFDGTYEEWEEKKNV